MAKQGPSNNNLFNEEYDEELLKACLEAEKQSEAPEEACDTCEGCRWREWSQWRAANGATLLEALLLLEFAALERLHKG